MTSLIERAKNIIISPKKEWEVIKTEEVDAKEIFLKYVLPLALIPAIANFIGYGLIGKSYIFVGRVASMKAGIIQAIISLVSTLGAVYITALVINALAPGFGGTKNMNKAMQLVAFSYTATFVAGVFYILPALSPIAMLAGLYSLYILYLGLKPLMNPSDDKVTVYFIISILVLIVAYFVIGFILGLILVASVGLSL